jgi:beta-lactamase regulating signal transducer with metallopeptidase domain
MSDLAMALLSYATEHLVISAVAALAVFGVIRMTTLTPETRARAVLLALAFTIVAPLLPAPAFDADVHATSAASDAGASTTAVDQVPIADEATAHHRRLSTSARIGIPPSIAAWLIGIWLLGTGWQGLALARARRDTNRIVAASERSRQFESTYRDILPAGIEIRLTTRFGPAVVGVFKPTILIPHDLAAMLPPASLRAVILHEVSHIQRRDPLVFALQTLAETALWWNPAFRWTARVLDASRESACDQRASRSSKSPIDYAESLLAAIERLALLARTPTSRVLGVASAMQSLDRRIEDIIVERKPPGVGARIFIAALALVAGSVWLVADAALPRLSLQRDGGEPSSAAVKSLPMVPGPIDATGRYAGAATIASEPTMAREDDAQNAEQFAIDAHARIVDLHRRHQNRLARIYADHSATLESIDADYPGLRAQADRMPTSEAFERELRAIEQRHDTTMRMADEALTRTLEAAENQFESDLRTIEADDAKRSANRPGEADARQ